MPLWLLPDYGLARRMVRGSSGCGMWMREVREDQSMPVGTA